MAMQIFSKLPAQFLGYSVATLLSLGMTSAQAASPDSAPATLTTTLAQLEQAATRQDLDQVLGFYSSRYSNPNGLDRDSYGEALSQLWSTSPNLSYDIELLAWEETNNGYMAETLTTVTGIKETGGKEMQLESQTRSRQYFENNQILKQEILSEQTTLKTGENPPEVQVNLPDQVMVGQNYNFDAIVQEPLGSDLLLGAVLEEPISPDQFATVQDLNLELLQAGGLFKVGRAPLSTEDRWISAVLIRSDGITVVTQRLQVIDPMASL